MSHPSRPHPRSEKLTISVTVALKTQLEAEAWESQRSLSDYVRGLLERRGKWARAVGTAGGYDIQAIELAPVVKANND